MGSSEIYITISILVFASIIIFLFSLPKNKSANKISPLAGLAIGLVVSGTIFGAERIIGYSLIGSGVLLSVIDLVRNRKRKKIAK